MKNDNKKKYHVEMNDIGISRILDENDKEVCNIWCTDIEIELEQIRRQLMIYVSIKNPTDDDLEEGKLLLENLKKENTKKVECDKEFCAYINNECSGSDLSYLIKSRNSPLHHHQPAAAADALACERRKEEGGGGGS